MTTRWRDMKRQRVVIEMYTNKGVKEKDLCWMVKNILSKVQPTYLAINGVEPSSLNAKQYSRVVAAEFGALDRYEFIKDEK